jgi:hypothetical protein
MTHLQKSLIVLSSLTVWFRPVCGQETEQDSKKRIEAPSPDGKYAFRYTKHPASNPDADSEKQTYDLIDRKSKKKLTAVAESDPDLGPSARFAIEGVLWKRDSKAFAITALLWKRGSSVSVFVRDGSAFREIELPELVADIPDKVKRGKSFPHMNELNSQSAKGWQKDGSLVVEIETIQDGNDEGLAATATRTVVLGFDGSKKAKVLKSTTKFVVEKQY